MVGSRASWWAHIFTGAPRAVAGLSEGMEASTERPALPLGAFHVFVEAVIHQLDNGFQRLAGLLA